MGFGRLASENVPPLNLPGSRSLASELQNELASISPNLPKGCVNPASASVPEDLSSGAAAVSAVASFARAGRRRRLLILAAAFRRALRR